MGRRLGHSAVAVVLGGLLCAGGCQDPAVQKRNAYRWKRIDDQLREFAKDERQGNADVREGVREAQRQWYRDVHQAKRTRRELDQWLIRDQRSWQMRQPEYRRGISQELRGNPEHIRPTSLRMLF
jgi:hypothetical protein